MLENLTDYIYIVVAALFAIILHEKIGRAHV